jgi:deoxyribose-phosphate aldolase
VDIGAVKMIDFTKISSKKEVGKLFDYAILPKQTTEKVIRDACKEAIEYNVKALCFSSSYWTPVVAEELKGTDILVGAGIGFPSGNRAAR